MKNGKELVREISVINIWLKYTFDTSIFILIRCRPVSVQVVLEIAQI
jgi:hypothetical protein